MNDKAVLYISYNGLMEPLGQSQVLQYLIVLANNYDITLISYEKSNDWADTKRRKELQKLTHNKGIKWVPLRYHRSPSVVATAHDIVIGFAVSVILFFRYRFKIVHARSYVPSLIAVGLKRIFGVRFIFDMRGFWPDERLNSGQWEEKSIIYRIAKWFERSFLEHADVVVSLTHAAVPAILSMLSPKRQQQPPIEVIPTCVNLGKFRPVRDVSVYDTSGMHPFTLGCVGSVGGWFLFDLVLRFFKCLLEYKTNSVLLILTRDDHSYIYERIKAYNIPLDSVAVKAVMYSDVSKEMGHMDAGIFFYRYTFSELARSPTKMAEFLACGVPCIANSGIGDVEKIVDSHDVGVVLHDFTPKEISGGVRKIIIMSADKNTRNRCVEVATKYFSLSNGCQSYERIYQELGDT